VVNNSITDDPTESFAVDPASNSRIVVWDHDSVPSDWPLVSWEVVQHAIEGQQPGIVRIHRADPHGATHFLLHVPQSDAVAYYGNPPDRAEDYNQGSELRDFHVTSAFGSGDWQVIPDGLTTMDLVFWPLADGVSEPTETIIRYLPYNDYGQYTLGITIPDPYVPPPQIRLEIANSSVTAPQLGWAPVARDDAFATAMEEVLTGNVLTNDLDYDDAPDPLEAVLLQGPAHAAAFSLYSDGSFSYTPLGDFVGNDFFTYRASDGDWQSNEVTVALASASGFITPGKNQKGVTGDEVKSVQENGKKHYVSPKAADSNVVLRANLLPLNQKWDPAIYEWRVNGQPTNGMQNKPWQIEISRGLTGKFVVELWNKQGNKAFDTTIVWVVWADATTREADPLNVYFQSNQDKTTTRIVLGKLINHWFVEKAHQKTIFTISPESIITDDDRPDFQSGKPSAAPSVPDSETNVHRAGLDLSKGANAKWDVSRQIRIRVIKPEELDLSAYKAIDGEPGYATKADWPSGQLMGNDDRGDPVGRESNDPYRDAPFTATLTNFDAPLAALDSRDGAIDNIVEKRMQFIDFARLNINGNWFRISDDYDWHANFKFKKVSEQVADIDYNADGDKNDELWIDFGSSAGLEHEGWGED
jgi:hypothetical protein